MNVMHAGRLLSLSLIALLAIPPAGAYKPADPFRSRLDRDREVAHALSRLAYGARPGDVEQVKKLGLKKWIELQLNPEQIPENDVVQAKLKPLESLTMAQSELIANYPPPQIIVATALGRMKLPDDPDKRALYGRLADRYRKKIQKKDPDKNPANNAIPPAKPGADFIRRGMFASAPVEARRRMLQNNAPQQAIAHDLVEGKLYRAIYSNRQLAEVLTDFWFNHFNVYLDKGADRFLVTSYERDAIRPFVLGNFREMLQATAEHPAMLWYLDNWQSVAPGAEGGRRAGGKRPGAPGKKRQRGLNENYARELLELHTLGVDGGYTQKDIIEVARCFTGWTIRDAYRGGGFEFNARMHDNGEKIVLGNVIPAGGGKEDGLKVLDIISKHPSTARFLSRKLAQKFVADNPPQSLIDSMANTFRKTDGNIREVMRTLVNSREFRSEGAWRAKVKSPFDVVVSAARATGADVTYAFGLGTTVGELGQPLYRKAEPTGYYDFYEEWVSSAGLLGRMNFGLALTSNKVIGSKVDLSNFGTEPEQIAQHLLPVPLSAETRNALSKAKDTATVAGLVIGSPEFQRK